MNPSLNVVQSQLSQLLASKSVSRIDFVFGPIVVDAVAFMSVGQAITFASLGARGVGLVLGDPPAGAAAYYDAQMNRIVLPRSGIGPSAEDRAVVVHECVHAFRDIQGYVIYNPNKLPAYPTRTEDEGAGYVAQALYTYFETGRKNTANSKDMIFVKAFDIANKVVSGQKVVSSSDVMHLRGYVANSPLYKRHGLKLWNASLADGIDHTILDVYQKAGAYPGMPPPM